MDVLEVIKNRRSIRSYQDKPVEEDKLKRVLEAGRRAPSARNRQEWRYVIVTDREERMKLMEAAYSQSFVGRAPVVIAACAVGSDYRMSCGQHAYPIDVAISVDHMTLQAVAEGLGTCWIGQFNEESVKKILHIPKEVRVVQLLILGYPGHMPEPTQRISLDEIACYGSWKW